MTQTIEEIGTVKPAARRISFTDLAREDAKAADKLVSDFLAHVDPQYIKDLWLAVDDGAEAMNRALSLLLAGSRLYCRTRGIELSLTD